ncbi:MAG: 2-C-methyl-D-erythritol 4-phosphate cytidylyltransferase [Candidatus Pacebacteria bacterium]|nr:2-C-methyl-D-erythritol 4-phosphate cytidylyltransferase [Candidatus Paceibacterota bacterium]
MKKILLLAGGSGSRFKSEKPKQFHIINRKMMIEFVVSVCLAVAPTDQLYIVCNKSWCDFLSKRLKSKPHIIPGGETRIESTLIGLKSMNPRDEDYIYIVESNRPLLKSAHLRKLFSVLQTNSEKKGAIYINDIKESIFKSTKRSVTSVPKSGFSIGQTPYLLKGEVVQKLLKKSPKKLTDELDILSLVGINSLLMIKTEFNNIKVTTKQDFKIVSAILK